MCLLHLLTILLTLGAGWPPGQHPAQTDSLAPPPVAPPVAPSDEPPDEAEEIHELVGRLGSPVFDERQHATERLLELGSRAYGVLAREYRASDDYEVRLRIQDIVTRCFFRETLFGRNGFLGIGLNVLSHSMEERVPLNHSGVEIVRVVEATAADRAGLRRGDLIVAIDDEPLPGDLDGDGFSRIIRDAGPGTMMRFTLYRQQRLQSVEVTLGPRPLEYYNEPRHLQMLEQTTRQFDRWWSEHFDPGSDPTDHRPPTSMTAPTQPERPPPPDSDAG